MDAPTPPTIGRNVVHGDVMPFAKRSCKTCFGSGEFVKCRGSNAPPLPNGEQKIAKLCGCALKRFLAKHRQDVEQISTGALVWRHEPKQES